MGDSHETRKAILASLFNKITFDEWLEIGMSENWCGPAVCYTHDSFPMNEEEDNEFADGNDPCMHMIRLYEDNEHKELVEETHSPSQWRKPYKQ
jgi:hypothetical protein